MFKNESEFTRWMSACLKKCNCLVFALAGSLHQTKGVPDRYVSSSVAGFPSGGLWIEVKKDGGRLTYNQKCCLQKLLDTNANACVIRLSGNAVYFEVLDERGDTDREFYSGLPYIVRVKTPSAQQGVEFRSWLIERYTAYLKYLESPVNGN